MDKGKGPAEVEVVHGESPEGGENEHSLDFLIFDYLTILGFISHRRAFINVEKEEKEKEETRSTHTHTKGESTLHVRLGEGNPEPGTIAHLVQMKVHEGLDSLWGGAHLHKGHLFIVPIVVVGVVMIVVSLIKVVEFWLSGAYWKNLNPDTCPNWEKSSLILFSSGVGMLETWRVEDGGQMFW